MNIRKYVTAGLATVGVVALCGLCGCASCSREMKSLNSDINGGIERTVTLYDNTGKEIKSWHGKFDIESNDQEFFFDDSQGKRVIIQGGIVMSEED
ncbi:hypothetical protein [Collinsella bouchesdurhonensis]|uniref:hypothetical protein n=1 Tax=Collinsella bouchesdurhonensis TaxID=1907654 RepID=UPI0034A5C8EA